MYIWNLYAAELDFLSLEKRRIYAHDYFFSHFLRSYADYSVVVFAYFRL